MVRLVLIPGSWRWPAEKEAQLLPPVHSPSTVICVTPNGSLGPQLCGAKLPTASPFLITPDSKQRSLYTETWAVKHPKAETWFSLSSEMEALLLVVLGKDVSYILIK